MKPSACPMERMKIKRSSELVFSIEESDVIYLLMVIGKTGNWF